MALLSCNGVLELLPHGSRLSCGVRRPPRPDSFKRRLGGFRETQDVAVWVLNVEVPCAPRTLLERFRDRRTAAHELVVQCADVGYVKEGIKVLPGPAIGPFGLKFRGALEMDRHGPNPLRPTTSAPNARSASRMSRANRADCVSTAEQHSPPSHRRGQLATTQRPRIHLDQGARSNLWAG